MLPLAAINGTKNFYNIPEKVLEVGVQGTSNIINLIKKYKVKNFFSFHLQKLIKSQQKSLLMKVKSLKFLMSSIQDFLMEDQK